jgi:hypothetical protein
LVALALASMGMDAQSCGPKSVVVPSAGQDRAPVVKIAALAVGGSATVSPTEIDSTMTVRTASVLPSATKCEIPVIMITASAGNDGGVKQLSLNILQDENPTPIYQVTVSASVDSKGMVPAGLGILGSDGKGGIGGQALRLEFSSGKAGTPKDHKFTVAASATNFNGQTTQLTETITSQIGNPQCAGE